MKVVDGTAFSDREAMLLSFVVRNQGRMQGKPYERLWRYAEQNWNIRDKSQLDDMLQDACSLFDAEKGCLFLCQGRSCTRQKRFGDAQEVLRGYAREYGIPIITTKCHGPCKQGPISTLKVGGEWEMFSQFHEQEDWESIVRYSNQAVGEEKLLADAGAAQVFRYDPLQGDKPSIALRKLTFLLGDYVGKNKPGFQASYPQLSTVRGQMEAGGRYLSLRVETRLFIDPANPYTIAATLMIGVNEDNGKLEAWGFSNGGTRQHYAVTIDDDNQVIFDQDAEPEASGRTRRTIVPNAEGWEESLAYDGGAGFRTYSMLQLKRRHARHRGETTPG